MSLPTRVALIEAAALNQRLREDNLVLIQVTAAATYQQAHLPGALLVQPQELVCGIPPASGRLPPRTTLDALFTRLGHHPARHYVVYDDEGGGWAGRFAWTLDVIGHPNWSYLDGGMHAWHGAGLPFVQGPPTLPAPQAVNLPIDTRPIAEIADVLAAIDDPEQVIWDARSAEEYAGIRQTARRAGHIPGAVNLDWLALQDPSRDLRIISDLPELLHRHGISDKGGIITHCQSHHRSGLSYLCGRLLGLPIRAYHGAWSEWGNRDDTPVETV